MTSTWVTIIKYVKYTCLRIENASVESTTLLSPIKFACQSWISTPIALLQTHVHNSNSISSMAVIAFKELAKPIDQIQSII